MHDIQEWYVVQKNGVLIKFYIQYIPSVISWNVFVEICKLLFSEGVPNDKLICLDDVEQVKK
jgi:hypothetical protein